MAKFEQLELAAHRDQMIDDVRNLVEKYRAIFDWDVPEIDQTLADRLILDEIAKALSDIQTELLS